MNIADDWVLHHNNASAHTVLSIQEFLAKENFPVLPHPPYSPDLSLPLPQVEIEVERSSLRDKGKHKKFVTDELHTNTHLPKMTSGTAMISGKNIGTIV